VRKHLLGGGMGMGMGMGMGLGNSKEFNSGCPL
jgi:hypothetical protein